MSIAKSYENYSSDWWTPPEWIDWVSETFRTDQWFDPCPSGWDGDYSGLGVGWEKNTYCNHPGSRGSTEKWWQKLVLERERGNNVIWCAFSDEQKRHMRPSPYRMPGWLIEPRDRIGFIWGGPDTKPKNGKLRKHGERAKSPGNWTVFWSSVEPAPTPTPSVIVKTG